MTSPELQAIIEAIPPDFADPLDTYEAVRAKMAPFHGHPTGEGLVSEAGQAGGVGGWWFSLRNDVMSRRTVLFLHGGAFVSCRAIEYGFYAEIVVRSLSARVFVVDYRLAPEHHYPAALDDCFAAYRGLLQAGVDPRHVVCMGDSCGGGLVLSLLYRTRAAGLAMPAAAVSISGWLDLTDIGYAPNLGDVREPFVEPHWVQARGRDYVGGEGHLADPMVSPALGDPSGLAPLLCQVAERDLTRRATERFAARAKAANAVVEVDVQAGAVHGFQGIGSVPESVATWGRINAFVDRFAAV